MWVIPAQVKGESSEALPMALADWEGDVFRGGCGRRDGVVYVKRCTSARPSLRWWKSHSWGHPAVTALVTSWLLYGDGVDRLNWQRRSRAISSLWPSEKCHMRFGCQGSSCLSRWFSVWLKLRGFGWGLWAGDPINQLAPPFSSPRLPLSLPLSLAFCSWPGGSLQHLEVDGQPDSSPRGWEHWELGKCKP